MVQIILFSLLGFAVTVLLFFVIKTTIAPKRIEGIQKYIDQGKNSTAIKIAKSMISKDPRNYKAHYYLGKAYLADNKPELAFMEYKVVNQSAIFDKDVPEVGFRKQMAQLYYKFNQIDESLKEYLLLTKLEPNNGDNFYNAGKLFEERGKTEQALVQYKKAIKLDPKHVKAHAALGLLYYRTKQFAEAKQEIDLAIRLSPDTYSTYYYLGKIYKENKNFPAAVNAFEKSLRDPQFKQKSLIERGNCFMAVHSVDKAINEYDRAVKATTNESSQETLYARYFLACCYEKIRNIDLALHQWEKIYQQNHSFRDVATKLAEYKDLQANDNMKEYLTSNTDGFLEICKKIALSGFNLTIRDIEAVKHGCKCIATEAKNENWMSVRQQVTLIHFYRDTEIIEESILRSLLEELKRQNYSKCIICTSASFSRSALTFAENRPFELINKEKLEKILEGISL